MLCLPKPSQPERLSIPVLVVAVCCLVLIGLPIGGGASPSNTVDKIVPIPFVPVKTRFPENVAYHEAAETGQDFKASQPTLIVLAKRPITLAPEAVTHRVLGQKAQLGEFLSPTLSKPTQPATSNFDPRLQRQGKQWALSNAFEARIGADPWALDGVGFPNIETHGPDVKNQYKRFQALMDWTLANEEKGEWTPIPAVYCMGLSAQQIAKRAAKHEREILSYAIEYGVSASLVKAVITKESCFNTKAVSRVGAEGLMQLMPETARWLKVTDRNDVNQNLSAGIRYLADLRKRFGSEELALAAYNAGPGNVERHGGIPPFKETQQYVKSVMAHYRSYAATSRFANRRVSN